MKKYARNMFRAHDQECSLVTARVNSVRQHCFKMATYRKWNSNIGHKLCLNCDSDMDKAEIFRKWHSNVFKQQHYFFEKQMCDMDMYPVPTLTGPITVNYHAFHLVLLYTNSQSRIFLVFYWSRAYHVRVTKLGCLPRNSARGR
jgi:hypothetical protein